MMPVRHGTELKLLARPPAQSVWGLHLQTLPLSQSYWMVTSELDLWVLPLPASFLHSCTCRSRSCNSPLVFWGSNNKDPSKRVGLLYWLVIPFHCGFQPAPGPLGIIVRRSERCFHMCIFSINRSYKLSLSFCRSP